MSGGAFDAHTRLDGKGGASPKCHSKAEKLTRPKCTHAPHSLSSLLIRRVLTMPPSSSRSRSKTSSQSQSQSQSLSQSQSQSQPDSQSQTDAALVASTPPVPSVHGSPLVDSYTYQSPVPSQARGVPCILGVDEAGRGPVLGRSTLCTASLQNCILTPLWIFLHRSARLRSRILPSLVLR